MIISPSDLSFLFDRCRRCMWAKLHGYQAPKTFNVPATRHIDLGMKQAMEENPAPLRDAGLPVLALLPIDRARSAATVDDASRAVLSVSGRPDAVWLLEEGGAAVIDYKAGRAHDGLAGRYRAAMHAYWWALTHPAQGEALDVRRLALAVWDTERHNVRAKGELLAITAPVVVIEIEIEPAWWQQVAAEIAGLSVQRDVPDAGERCDFCAAVDARNRAMHGWAKQGRVPGALEIDMGDNDD